MSAVAWTLAALAAIGLWAAWAWNRLVRLRAEFRNAFAQIDVQLKRRYDLVPNLVEATRAYLAHERATLESVAQARSRAMDARSSAAADPTDPRAMAALQSADAALGRSLGPMFALVESYPELKADANVRQLVEELASTENRIAFARQAFNDAAMQYNATRESVPIGLVATAGGFREATLLAATGSEVERAAPGVRF